MVERKTLDFSLDEFDVVKPKKISKEKIQKEIKKTSKFPSREQVEDDQINIRGSREVLDRFRQMAKNDRYKHGAFLEILMEHYES